MLSNPAEFSRKFPRNRKKLREYILDFSDKELNDLFLKRFFLSKKSLEDLTSGKRIFLYLGQPLSELGILSKRDETSLIQSIQRSVELKGYKFLLKPHPKDSRHKYPFLGNALIDSLAPVEIILKQHQFFYLGSFSSSASYNSAGLLDCKSLVFSKVLGVDLGLPKKKNLIEIDNLESLNKLLT